MRQLVTNQTASLSELACEVLHACARTDADLAEELTRRPDLPGALAAELAESAAGAAELSVQSAFGDGTGVETLRGEDVLASSLQDDEDNLAKKLVQKLEAAGTLNGTFALRALTQGNDPLFDHSISSMCTLNVEQWRKALAAGGVRAAALACRAARIDRSVFPTVLRGLQRSGRIHADLSDDAMAAAAKVFTGYTAGSAHDSLRRIADSV